MIYFKNERDKEMFTELNLFLILVYADLATYAKLKHNIDLVVTETITTDKQDRALKRVSDAHQKGIALDIRANDINRNTVFELCDYINNKEEFKKFHYMSFSGTTRLAYPHGEGSNFHIHLQVHQRFADMK